MTTRHTNLVSCLPPSWGEPAETTVLEVSAAPSARGDNELAQMAAGLAQGGLSGERLHGVVSLTGGHLREDRYVLLAEFQRGLGEAAVVKADGPATYCEKLVRKATEIANSRRFDGANIELAACVALGPVGYWILRVGANSVWRIDGDQVSRVGADHSRRTFVNAGVLPFDGDLTHQRRLIESLTPVFTLQTPDGFEAQCVERAETILVLNRGLTPLTGGADEDVFAKGCLAELWTLDSGWRHGLPAHGVALTTTRAGGTPFAWPQDGRERLGP